MRQLRLFLINAIWRVTGLRSAGEALVRALASDEEEIRMLAGMFLVQAGKRAEPLLSEALTQRRNLPTVLTILGDINARHLEGEIRSLSEDRDPNVAKAAVDALRILNSHQPLSQPR